MPEPGNRSEKSKSDTRGEIAQWCWGRMFTADAFGFIAMDSEALDISYFAHSPQRFTVDLNPVL
jgi:hypothetical protein